MLISMGNGEVQVYNYTSDDQTKSNYWDWEPNGPQTINKLVELIERYS